MPTAVIYGVTGQDGSYLTELLLNKNYRVFGVSRRSSHDNTNRIKHLIGNERLILKEGDVTDMGSVCGTLRDAFSAYPAGVVEVYNLAAQSHVKTSFDQPGYTWDVTAKGCLNILEAIKNVFFRMHSDVRFYQASSSEM